MALLLVDRPGVCCYPSTCLLLLLIPTHFHPVTPSRAHYTALLIPTCLLHALPLFTSPLCQRHADDDDDDLLVNVNRHPLVDEHNPVGRETAILHRHRYLRYNIGNSRALFAPSPITWLAQRRRCTKMCTPRRCAAPAWATLAPSHRWGQPPERGIPPG